MATKVLSCNLDVSISSNPSYVQNAYNQADRLAFGQGSGGLSSDGYYALLGFDSLGLPANQIIDSAILTITKRSGAIGSVAGFSARALRITSGWSEGTSYNTRPSTTTTGASPSVPTGEGHTGSIAIDVTDIVKAWYAGSAQHGLWLEKASGESGVRLKTIYDRTSGSAAYITVTYRVGTTAATAPTSLSVSPTLSEGNATLSWSGAAGGVNNAIASYEIQYRESTNGTTWGSWAALTTVTSTTTSGTLAVAPSGTRGSYRQYRIRTRGTAGADYYSGWRESSNSLRKNRLPNAPVVQGDSTLRPESVYAIAWAAASDPDGQAVTYLVQRGVWNGSTYAWLSDVTVTGTSYNWNITGYPRGQRLYMTVKSRDSLGAVSAAAGTGSAVYRNQVPAAPTVAWPVNNSTIYNAQPRVGLTMGSDPDGNTMAGRVAVNGVLAVSDGANQSYWSRTGRFGSGVKAVVRGATAPAGARTVQASAHDGQVEGGSVTRNITVAVPVWTDPALTPGTTKIKAAHISELRAAINHVRAYYGLAAYSWTDPTLTPGTSKIKAVHIQELRTAIEAIRTLVNGFDATNVTHDIPAFNWTDPTLVPGTTKIKAAHIAEIRALIPTL